MCDDIKRQFFLSNEYWHGALLSFITLMHTLMGKSKKVINILLEYDGLLDTLLQVTFFGMERQDIVEESKL